MHISFNKNRNKIDNKFDDPYFINIIKFFSSKDTVRKVKNQATEEEIFGKHADCNF